MLNVKNISKYFGKNKILNNINLNLYKGEIVAIIGPSGSGKSTLLKCINALEVAQQGIIKIDNASLDYSKYTKKDMLCLRQKSAMVFQHYNLFANKNALENITESLIIVKKMSKEEAIDVATMRLKEVGLLDKANFYPHQLSGGQQQRIGIARALAIKPSIILFDEPTSSLDPELVEEVLSVILDIKDTTMLIVTHELHFARVLANRIIFMQDGEFIEENNSNDFFLNPKHKRTQSFLQKMLMRYKNFH